MSGLYQEETWLEFSQVEGNVTAVQVTNCSGTVESQGNSRIKFLRNKLFSWAAVLFYIPINSEVDVSITQISLCPHQQLQQPVFFIIIIIAILVGVIWDLVVVLICIALKTNNIIFICLMVICKSSFNKYPFRTLYVSKLNYFHFSLRFSLLLLILSIHI